MPVPSQAACIKIACEDTGNGRGIITCALRRSEEISKVGLHGLHFSWFTFT